MQGKHLKRKSIDLIISHNLLESFTLVTRMRQDAQSGGGGAKNKKSLLPTFGSMF